MAKINGGKGFKEFDYKAWKIEKELIEKELKKEREKKKRGRKRKPRSDKCIYCGKKKRETVVNIDPNEFGDTRELLSSISPEEEHKYVCESCRSFWGISQTGESFRPCPGWEPLDAIERIEDAKEKGYVTILKSQSFSTPKGNVIEVEIGDVFPLARAGAEFGSDVSAKDFYSIDIMVGVEKLTLFPWEIGTISWIELMEHVRKKEYEAVYLGDGDIAGYFEPSREVREILKAMFE